MEGAKGREEAAAVVEQYWQEEHRAVEAERLAYLAQVNPQPKSVVTTLHPVRSDVGEDWRLKSACRGQASELFFAAGSTKEIIEKENQAKAICRTCPVMGSCLEDALNNDYRLGIWGGKTPNERKKLMQRRQHRAAS